MIRGQKFEIDLGDDDGNNDAQDGTSLPGAFVGDILERKPAAPSAPAAPTLKSKTGFPEHKKRNVESRFKQRSKARTKEDSSDGVRDAIQTQDDNHPSSSEASGAGKVKTWEEEEKQRIDLENRRKIAQMSPEEIEEERRELMNSLSPGLLQRLLQRSNIDSGTAEEDLSNQPQNPVQGTQKPRNPNPKSVSFAELSTEDTLHGEKGSIIDADNDNDAHDVPETDPLPHESVHFPRPPQPPDLDPSSETFFEDLHQKYFPSLPSDPDKLEWMQTSTSTIQSYDPSASALDPKDLRFSFKGELIPPRTALDIPVTAGLHHHGDAPDAAGYTIPELAHLAQSSFPAQRCIAFQTLGRILYRLGIGEFGDSGEPGADTMGSADTFGELARGLWQEVDKEKVIEILVTESEGNGVDKGRHVSAKAYATEAVWLWRKGGGRRWKAS